MPLAADEKSTLLPGSRTLLLCLALLVCGYVYPLLRSRPVDAPVSMKIFPAPALPALAEQP